MASIVADRALERRVLTARAMRFPLIVTMAVIIAAATLPSTDAHAQFACVGTLGASDVTCTNTGATAVPFILEELKTEPDDWFWALSAITGENPVQETDAGNMHAMTKAWLQWGREKGLVA